MSTISSRLLRKASHCDLQEPEGRKVLLQDHSIALGVPWGIPASQDGEGRWSIRGIPPGTRTRTLPFAKFWRELGMRFLGCSSEAGMLLERGTEVVRELR